MAQIDNIVKNINEKREKLGLSVDQLSKKSNISFSTLTKIRLKEVQDVRVSTLSAIAKVLGCTVDDMIN
jgi:DNA-binding Xre family transcriptional regulator